jgi:hypothetical protein
MVCHVLLCYNGRDEICANDAARKKFSGCFFAGGVRMAGDDFGGLNGRALLAEIDRAIQAVSVGGQEYVIGNRRLRRADLAALLSARKQLRAAAQADEAENADGFAGLFPVFFAPR